MDDWKSSERLTEKQIHAMFTEMDRRQLGWINEDDVAKSLYILGFQATTYQTKLVFKTIDRDKDGKITLPEFTSFVQERQDLLYKLFQQVDKNSDGQISNDELLSFLRQKLHIVDRKNMLNDVSQCLMSRIDVNKDGHCSFREFAKLFLLLPEVDMEMVFEYWTKASHIDMGENYVVPDEPSVEKSRANIFISGAVAGCISRSMTAPLDRLKVIFQAGKGDKIINSLVYMYREGGWSGFFRGNGVNCMKIAPESAAKFLFYDEFKQIVAKFNGGDHVHPTIMEKFIAGAAAGALAQFLIYPMEIMKTRLALSTTGEFRGIADVATQIVRDGGFRSMYRGLLPSILGIVPYAGIDLMVFNTLKDRWMALNSSKQVTRTPDVFTLLFFGATSTTCGQFVAYPLQLIRTKLQADKGTATQRRRYTGMIHCFKETYKERGFIGLYRGLGPNLLKSIPAISISYAVFEKFSNMIHGIQLWWFVQAMYTKNVLQRGAVTARAGQHV